MSMGGVVCDAITGNSTRPSALSSSGACAECGVDLTHLAITMTYKEKSEVHSGSDRPVIDTLNQFARFMHQPPSHRTTVAMWPPRGNLQAMYSEGSLHILT